MLTNQHFSTQHFSLTNQQIVILPPALSVRVPVGNGHLPRTTPELGQFPLPIYTHMFDSRSSRHVGASPLPSVACALWRETPIQ